jgi:hypothetical protein
VEAAASGGTEVVSAVAGIEDDAGEFEAECAGERAVPRDGIDACGFGGLGEGDGWGGWRGGFGGGFEGFGGGFDGLEGFGLGGGGEGGFGGGSGGAFGAEFDHQTPGVGKDGDIVVDCLFEVEDDTDDGPLIHGDAGLFDEGSVDVDGAGRAFFELDSGVADVEEEAVGVCGEVGAPGGFAAGFDGDAGDAIEGPGADGGNVIADLRGGGGGDGKDEQSEKGQARGAGDQAGPPEAGRTAGVRAAS